MFPVPCPGSLLFMDYSNALAGLILKRGSSTGSVRKNNLPDQGIFQIPEIQDTYLRVQASQSPAMKEIYLTIRKRAFPSQGRVRFNITHLTELGIKEGDRVDLVNEATKKSVTVTVIADTIVREGQVRVSEEDAKSIGLNEDDTVLLRKSTATAEKIRKAGDAAPGGDPDSPKENVKKRARKAKPGTASVAV